MSGSPEPLAPRTGRRRPGRLPLPLFLLALGALMGCDPIGPLPPEPTELDRFFESLQADAEAFAPTDGAWSEHYGDAPFYGLAFHARMAHSTAGETASHHAARADEAATHNADLLAQSVASTTYLIDHLDTVVLATMGLMEWVDATGDTTLLPDIVTVIQTIDDLLAILGDYADASGPGVGTYGPTTMTAAVVLLNVQFALYFPGRDAEAFLERAEAIVLAINAAAFEGGRYRFAPLDDRQMLYPNVMMMLALGRLTQATGDRGYDQTARSLLPAIEPLFDPAKGNYRSPYSAAYMGATTEDYSTLSSQNYLGLALLVLYENSRDPAYLGVLGQNLTFVHEHLYDAEQGRILHHWMDGRIAQPQDPEYFCTGCNLQHLYLLWYLRERAL